MGAAASSCPICDTADSTSVSSKDRHGKALETRVCAGCGLVFNDPIPDDAALAKFYSEDYRKEYKGAARPRGRQIVRNFRRTADHVARFSDVFDKVQTVLDVGAGSGEFVFAMQAMGKDVRGIEPNQDYAAYCRSDLSIDVETKQILDVDFAPESFDFINLSHVFEHLNDPLRYLEIISNWLKPDGYFYVEVPNIFLYASAKSQGNMFHFGHIFNYSPLALRAAGARVGLVEDTETAERCARKTGVFFRKSSTTTMPKDALNAENAARVLTAVENNIKSGPTSREGKGFIEKNLRRVDETLTSRRYSAAADIGKAVLQQKGVI